MEQNSILIQQRRKKLEELREKGLDPYPCNYAVKDYSADIIEKLSEEQSFEDNQYPVQMAGRIMSMRGHGKVSFAHIQDSTGKIQIYVRKNEVGDEVYDELYKRLDIGDIIGVKGWIFRTRTGELTVHVKELTLLCKSLRPLPEKWHGLTDKEIRYRQRYLDLMVNEDVKKVFLARTKIVKLLRDFLDSRDFVEVETPILQPIYGGANARPFITHHNALDVDFYLRIADELYLKRLIVGGIDRVYEIAKDFRNEGIDKDHSPEFTMLELYQAYADYQEIMLLTEEMISYTASELYGTTVITYQEKEIDLAPPWRRVSMLDSIKEAIGTDIRDMSAEELVELAKSHELEVQDEATRGKLINLFFEEFVEEELIQPTFITDYPIDISPFAKKKRDDDDLTERFEIFIGGMEMGNAFSELNDPIDQRERFLDQTRQKEAGDEEAHVMDEDYLRALEYGMPPTGGLGMGIGRLVMLLTDMPSLRDVILFPQMRPEHSASEEVEALLEA